MKPQPLREFAEKTRVWESLNEDALTMSDTVEVSPEGKASYIEPGTMATLHGSVPISYQGLTQLNARLDGPPMRWTGDPDHCPPPLRGKLLTYLAKSRKPESLLMREHDGTLRAVLSDDYTRFDHGQFIDLVTQAVESMGPQVNAQVFRAEIGDEMRAYVLLPEVTFGQLPGTDDGGHGNGGLHPGIYISNSEIGTGAARTSGGLYRATCQNGMIYGWSAGEIVRVRHLFIHQAALLAVIASAVAAGFKMSERAALAFIESQQIHMRPTGLEGLVEKWVTKYGLSVDRKADWLTAISTETATYGRPDDPRLFDVTNALTYIAREKDAAEREMMERAAGDLIGDLTPLLPFIDSGRSDALARNTQDARVR
jgi:hypothetical protein